MFIPTLNLISFSLTHTRNRSFRLQKPSMEALQGNRTVFWVQSCIGGEKRPIQCPSDLAKLIWGGTKAILSYGTPGLLWLTCPKVPTCTTPLGKQDATLHKLAKAKRELPDINLDIGKTLLMFRTLQSSSVRWWFLFMQKPTEKQPLQAHLASHCPYIPSGGMWYQKRWVQPNMTQYHASKKVVGKCCIPSLIPRPTMFLLFRFAMTIIHRSGRVVKTRSMHSSRERHRVDTGRAGLTTSLNMVERSCLQRLKSPLAAKLLNLANWTTNWLRTSRSGYGAPPPLHPPRIHLRSLTW